MVSLQQKKQAVTSLVKALNVSRRFACDLLNLQRSSFNYSSKVNKEEIVKRVCDVSNKYPRWGYRKITDYLRLQGVRICKERVRSIRKQYGLQVKRKQCRRRILRSKPKLHEPQYPNHVWSWDFMFDATHNGRKLKVLNIIDEYTKELLVSYAARTITAEDVYRLLRKLFAQRGLPAYIRSDNGPEFVAKYIQKQVAKTKVNIIYIQPGSPWQNCYIESFNSIMRDNLLNRYLFFTPKEAQIIIDDFKQEYNYERPHGTLGGITPKMFADKCSEENFELEKVVNL